MWLVTWESKADGKWVADPECFRKKSDAVKYMDDCRDVLMPKNRMALYRCSRQSVVFKEGQPRK
jgi:hypothetical protein